MLIEKVTDKDGDFVGTGHNNVFAENGQDWLVHHAKKPSEDYKAYLNIRKLDWDENKWPTVCAKN